MAGKKSTHVSNAKKKAVEKLRDLIANKKTILIASIKSVPGSQFQEISKKLRGKAIVKVPKKSLIFRAIDETGNATVKKLEEQIGASTAVLFSDLDSYELAGELLRNKSPAKAKPGQEAPEDIEIQAGPTDLVPGPAVSELGAVGLQIEIKEGKIHIRQPKIIVKKGEKISENAANIMAKLDIKPFSIGFTPLVAFDTQEGKLYTEIKINKEEAVESIKEGYGKALAFAVSVGYPSEETIKFLIGKAASHEKALNNLQENSEEVKEELVEEKETSEEKNEETQTPENKSGEEK